MRTEFERCEGEVRKLELKLEQARDLLSTETSQRKKAEQERDGMCQKWDMVREFISQSGDTMNDETRTRLQRLEASFASRRGTAIFSPGAALGLSPVNEDSTCSILDASDLSFDNTQGSVLGPADDSRLRYCFKMVLFHQLKPIVPGLAEPSSASHQVEVRHLLRLARRSDLEAAKVQRSLWKRSPPAGQPGRGSTKETLTHICPPPHPCRWMILS